MTSNSTRVFELGIGLFIVCLLWIFAIIVCFVTNRVKSKIAILGPSVVAVVTLISVILVCLPRSQSEKETEKKNVTLVTDVEKHMNRNLDNIQLASNWMNVWRILILLVNVIALLVGVALIYVKWLSKRIRRAKWSVVIKNSKSIDGE